MHITNANTKQTKSVYITRSTKVGQGGDTALVRRWYSSCKLEGRQLLLNTTTLNYTSYNQLHVLCFAEISTSLHVEFHELYWSIFIITPTSHTDSDLNLISCGGRQCYIEPWWWVEGAARASRTTPLSIPQRITVWKENTLVIITSPSSSACFTEIVLTHKWRNTTSTSAPSNTGACWNRDSPLFIKTISKCPEMFVGEPCVTLTPST